MSKKYVSGGDIPGITFTMKSLIQIRICHTVIEILMYCVVNYPDGNVNERMVTTVQDFICDFYEYIHFSDHLGSTRPTLITRHLIIQVSAYWL